MSIAQSQSYKVSPAIWHHTWIHNPPTATFLAQLD